MNQGIDYSILAMLPAMTQSGLALSYCTITVPADQVLPPDQAFGPSGAPLEDVPYIPLAGHVDIPCNAPTGFSVHPGDEMKTDMNILSKNVMPISLLGYFPAIIPDYRALINGIEYDILSVGCDSLNQTTRMVVQRATT